MKPDVIVLGAGMVGVCTALHLVERGHDVALVERGRPGGETSYGNAGVIQREAMEPYIFPRAFSDVLSAALKMRPDVNYHLRALPALAPSLLRYWWNSAPARYRPLARAYGRLIEHCIAEHAPLIEQAGADGLISREGFRIAFRTPDAFETGAAAAERILREHAVGCDILDADALSRAEPGLKQKLAGAVHWRDSWSVSDPGGLVARYAELFRRHGGLLVRGDAGTLRQGGAGWQVVTESGTIEARHAVIALGPWSGKAAKRLGYRIPLFVKRGYHRHYSPDGGSPVGLPLVDQQNGMVLAPMAQGLRITTGAEFARLDAPPTPVQLEKAERTAAELVDLGAPVESIPWCGARPCLPDMLPVIGPAPRHAGLWFHFGHAHQGFTLGAASGRLLAELISDERPFVDPAPYAPSRFAGAR